LGDIARQISAGLRCDSKKLKALQKSHSARQKSARMTSYWQASSTDGVAEKILFSACVRAPFWEVFILAPAVVFYSGDGSKRIDARQGAARRASHPADGRALPPSGRTG